MHAHPHHHTPHPGTGHIGADLASRRSSGVSRPGEGGCGRGGGLRTRCPERGLGAAPVTPLPSWLPRGSQGQHAPTRPTGGEHSASLKPQRGPASQSQGTPGLGGVAEQIGSHGHPLCEHHLCAGSQTDTRGQGSGAQGQDTGGKPDKSGKSGTGFSGRGSGEEQRWGREGGRGGRREGKREGRKEKGRREEEEGRREGRRRRRGTEPQSPPPGPHSSHCTSLGRWPSPSHSGPPHSCPAAAGRGFHAPLGPEGGEPRVTRQALSNAHRPSP